MVTIRYIYVLILLSACFLWNGCSEGGYKWNIVHDASPEVSFRGIAAVDESTCWVTGTGGTVLRTTDGGKNWQHVSIPGTDSLDFRDIEVFGEDTAVVMSIGSGSLSRLYRTEDGGNSWNMVHQNRYEEGFYDAIAFWDNGYGVLQGDPIEGRLFILITEDGGRSWKEIPQHQMPPVKEGEYAFAASGTQLIATQDGQAWIGTGGINARILHSDDYGKTWKSVSTSIIQGGESTGIFSLSFKDDSIGMAVGGDYTKEEEGRDNFIYSDDGGESWNLLSGQTPDFRSAVRYAERMFITVGPSGSEYSTDHGQTWNSIEGPGFHTLSIGKGGTSAVWAAGRKGRVGKLIKK